MPEYVNSLPRGRYYDHHCMKCGTTRGRNICPRHMLYCVDHDLIFYNPDTAQDCEPKKCKDCNRSSISRCKYSGCFRSRINDTKACARHLCSRCEYYHITRDSDYCEDCFRIMNTSRVRDYSRRGTSPWLNIPPDYDCNECERKYRREKWKCNKHCESTRDNHGTKYCRIHSPSHLT